MQSSLKGKKTAEVEGGEEFKGFICPLRSSTKEVYCVKNHCMWWVPYPEQHQDGPVTVFECAWWVMAYYAQGIFAHLSGLNKSVKNYFKNLTAAAPAPAAPKELSKADTMQYIQDRYPEIEVSPTTDGINLQGFIQDKETRDKYFAWIKAQGFRFYPDGPVKYWFKRFKQ